MAPLTRVIVLAVVAAVVTAQSYRQATWGAVVYTYHGEKTPVMSSTSSANLTPLGAQQLLESGTIIRDRYVSPPTSSNSTANITSAAVINGISVNTIDNSQLTILSMNDEYLSTSALAFMQGLYPPRGSPWVDEESLLGNGSLVQFPLDGYQYPNVGSVSTLDLNSIWVAGNADCNNYLTTEIQTLISPAYQTRILETSTFYTSLSSSVFWDFDPSILSYRYAWQLYEYALYEYAHNRTLYNSSTFTTSDLATLYTLASEQQFLVNAPNNETEILSIAGQTLAAKVLAQLYTTIASGGKTNKITLLFGSFEPFLSFFALSHLSTGPSASRFTSLPLHGSLMSFELFSWELADSNGNLNTSAPFPSTTDDLWVRFLFRNGTDDGEALIAYSLFDRGPSEYDMPWSDFVAAMAKFSMDDVPTWCGACDSITMFCEALLANTLVANGSVTTGTPRGAHLSPSVYGVVGATVTLVVALLLVGFFALLGFRIGHRERSPHVGAGVAAVVPDLRVLKRSGSAAQGGFKGAEKLASDTDLRLKAGGVGASVVRHERVGSWELNESPTSSRQQGSLDKDLESGRVVSQGDYGRRSEDDGLEHVNPFGDPVKAVDQV